MDWGLPTFDYSRVAPASPEEWIGYISRAEAVFTGSYHGLLFALYFHKQVWTDNYSNRICSLLNELDANICKLSEDVNCKSIINYDIVDVKISCLRNKSREYLCSMIKNLK